MTDKPEIICLCGSSRFVDVMAVIAWELEKEGKIVLSLHLLPTWYTREADHQAEHEAVAAAMDELHLRKIDLADRVFIVNKNGYVGKSTRREIEYATKLAKPIAYLEDPQALTLKCGHTRSYERNGRRYCMVCDELTREAAGRGEAEGA